MILEIIIAILLSYLAYQDIKYREMPSFLPTGFILAILIIQPDNLIFGIAGFIFGVVLYEFDFIGNRFFGGIADIKVMAIIGLMINSWFLFFVMMFLLGILSIGTAIILSTYYKGKMPKEIPFIPTLLILYIVVMVVKILL